MRILFIADPLASFKIYKDSTYAMMVEAARRGHALYCCEPQDLAWTSGAVVAQASALTLAPGAADWYRLDTPQPLRLTEFDAVLNRKDPPFDIEYVTTSWLLSAAEREGATIFNSPQAVRDHSEKLAIAEFAQFCAPTLVTRDAAQIRAFHAAHRDIVIKPLDGMGGMGVFRIGADAMNLGAVIETLGQQGARTLMAQRYLPAIADGDKRILLIGGQVVPYALARIPQGGEVRGNLAAGGLGRAQPLSARDLEIAQALAPTLAARGLLLVGLDVIGDHLTEVNVTSPTCFAEITAQTGCDVAAIFVDALEAAVA